jgi:hypothetical protein
MQLSKQGTFAKSSLPSVNPLAFSQQFNTKCIYKAMDGRKCSTKTDRFQGQPDSQGELKPSVFELKEPLESVIIRDILLDKSGFVL